MKYVVLVAADPQTWLDATPEERNATMDGHARFERAVAGTGTKLSGAALTGADAATTLRSVDGEWSVTDGPFVELAEQIGGFYLVDLPDLDAAIAACRELPHSYAVEIRPVLDIEGYDPT